MAELVLASASPFRRQLLEAAGLEFAVIPARIDERALEKQFTSSGQRADASEVACALAMAKARVVSEAHPAALVIGCDQVLEFEGALLSKTESILAAKAQLARLRGKTHVLHSGLCLARGGKSVWEHVDIARMSMRSFSDSYLEDYSRGMGERMCQTVGGYEIEGQGIQLFERIGGDHFTIIGLPLLPLLAKLRELQVLPS